MRPRGQSDSSVFGSRIQPAPICVETGERQVGVLDFARIPVRKIGMRRWMWVLKRLDSHHPQWADYRHFGEILGFDHHEMEHMATQPGGPTLNMFREWYTQDGATVESLVHILQQMNRPDIIEDVVDIVWEYHRQPPEGRRCRCTERPGCSSGKYTEIKTSTFRHRHDFQYEAGPGKSPTWTQLIVLGFLGIAVFVTTIL